MYFLVFAILLISLYSVWLAGKNRTQLDALENWLRERRQDNGRHVKTRDTLGYEWDEDGWPYDTANDDERERPFENPTPFYLSDAYGQGLLTAEYRGAVGAFEKKALLKRMLRTGASVPLAAAEEAFNDKDVSVRIYAASHMNLVYEDYAGDWENPRLLRDFGEVASQDPDPFVRAALLSNPHVQHVWNFWNPGAGCGKALSSLTQLERLAAMRNPKLNPQFIVGLMEEEPESLNTTVQEHIDVISVAVTNPRTVEESRKTGRDYWKGLSGDCYPPCDEYRRMWLLAVSHWLKESGWGSQAVPNLVFQYVQTTPETKLEIYKRLSEKNHSDLRRTILQSCNRPMDEKEVLKLGWSDSDEECRNLARERIGPHAKWVGVKPSTFAASASR